MIAKIKQNARRALGGNWGKAIAILLTLFAVSLLFVFFEALFYWVFHFTGGVGPHLRFSLDFIPLDYPLLTQERDVNLVPFLISTLSTLCGLLVLSPLSLGITRWYYELIAGEETEIFTIFSYFSHFRLYLRSVWYHIQIMVRSFLWSVALFAPGTLLFALCSYYLEQPGNGAYVTALSFGLVLSCVLLVLCAVVLILLLLRYFLTPYYLVEKPEWTVTQAIRRSVAGTREQKGNLLLFGLSFLPWLLLGVFLLPLLYVIPYLMASRALYAKVLITRDLRQIEQQESQQPLEQDDTSEA